jgi:hypothetical protein
MARYGSSFCGDAESETVVSAKLEATTDTVDRRYPIPPELTPITSVLNQFAQENRAKENEREGAHLAN